MLTKSFLPTWIKTPSGVFCPGRVNRQPIKFVVPNSFSYTAHIASSKQDASDYTGTLSTVRVNIIKLYVFFEKIITLLK